MNLFKNTFVTFDWHDELGNSILLVFLFLNMDRSRPLFRLISSYKHSDTKQSFNFNNYALMMCLGFELGDARW